MKKFILSLLCLCAFIFSSVSHAITINTAQINGKYYGLTGALNNPAVGVAVELGTAMLTKANPWLTGIGVGLTVYKIAEELFPGQIVAFRPGLVSESVPSWPGNQPPSTDPGVVSSDGYDYAVLPNITFLPYRSSADAAGADWVAYKCPSLGGTCSFTNTIGSAGSKSVNWTNTSPSGNVFPYNTALNARTSVKQCPSGYSLVSGNCNLTSASTVKYPSDGVSSFTVDENGKFKLDLRDPDIPAANLSGIAGQSSVTQKSSDGKQSSTTSANPDGSISHSTTNEYYDPTDASTRQFTQNFTINNAGAVTSYNSTNPVIQVVNGVAQPVSSSNQVVFPSDYARTNEAQSAADTVNVKLDTLHDDLTDPGTPNTDPTVPDNGQYTDFADTFSGLTGWSMPGHSSQCPTASFVSPWGTPYTFDSHCQLITDNWAVLQAAMTVVWTLAALFIVLKA